MSWTSVPATLQFIIGIVRAIRVNIFILLGLCLSADEASATHAAGAELTYKSLGGLVYQVEAVFYRDCGGTPEPRNMTITYKSTSCGYSRTELATKVSLNNGLEITTPCATSPSSCNGGISTGLQKWIYQAVITLPFACSDWVFSYRVCCRNCTVTTIQNPCAINSELYVEAMLNNVAVAQNNSPQFTGTPATFMCLGQNFNYNPGVVDSDGDSLVYELISPKTSQNTQVSWINPYSAVYPLNSSTNFLLNPNTGDINFTPSSLQVGVIAIRINEYRNGQHIGSVIRDMQVYTRSCFNAFPAASAINGNQGFSTSICAGQQICFSINTMDADSLQSVTAIVQNLPQGANVTTTPGPRPVLHFCWTPSTGDISSVPKVFSVYVRDNACPLNGAQIFSYSIKVNGSNPSVVTSDPICKSDTNGVATVMGVPAAGTTYLWDTNPIQNGATATGLGPGSYSVLVTDPWGCSNTIVAEINASADSLEVSATGSGLITCTSGNTGTGNAVVTGGVSPLSFAWSNGETNQNASNLGAGIHTVIVTDANGCFVSDTVVIQQSPANVMASAVMLTEIACTGGNTGVAKVQASGGVSPYSYLWSNGSASSTITNLTAGTYTATVTDANGCSATSAADVTESANQVSASISSVTHVQCFGDNTGAATVLPSGGHAPYTYYWSNGSAGQSNTNIPAGVYVVTVTDGNNCQTDVAIQIYQPNDAVTISNFLTTHVGCFGDATGSVSVAASGGLVPYSYLWATGDTTPALQNLPAGTYTITVNDSNGCSFTTTDTILQPEFPLQVTTDSLHHVSCRGDSTGMVSVQALQGTAPYTYVWNNGAITPYINNLIAGNYSVLITDNNGCELNHIIEITEPAEAININFDIIKHLNCVNTTGSVTVSASGGSGQFSYLWSNGETTRRITNLQPGNYTITVTDVNGCTAQSTVEILNLTGQLAVTVQSIQHILCQGTSTGQIAVSVNGNTGPPSFLWSSGATTASIQNLLAGTYSVTVTDSAGCQANTVFTLNEPVAPLLLHVTGKQHVRCYNGSDGFIETQISGGTLPYTYNWSNGQTTSGISNIGAGVYTVTVTDGNGCTSVKSIRIDQPASPVTGTITVTNNVTCFGGANGSAIINAFGGTGQLSYLWSNGVVGPVVTGLNSGNYSIIVTDSNQCVYTESCIISQPSQGLVISGTATNASCNAGSGGSIILEINGGTLPYSYNWSNGSSSASVSALVPGSYSVTVTDAAGCTGTAQFTIYNNQSLIVTAQGPTVICAGESVTLIADSLPEGTYQWYFNGNVLQGANAITFTTPAAGNYWVTYSGACGNLTSDTILVEVKSIGNVSVSNNQIICPPETATLQATGGTTYEWSPASYITFTNVPDPIVSPQVTTVYTVEISNQYGCKTTLSTQVAVVCDSLFVPTGFSPNSDGVNDGYVIDGIENYPGNKIWVYNRYGKLVFKATDYNNNWDGVANVSGIYFNKKVASGTYFYILDLNDRSKPRAGYLIIRW